jgi:hypothetical protein
MLAQRPTPQGSVSPYPKTSSTSKTTIDTLGKDSLRVDITRNINLSKDALDEPVDYEAKDSIIFDNKNNLVHLYREAVVKFQTIEVKAAYIVLNIKENLALAEPLKEKNGQTYGIPDFKDRDQTFKANKMRYNFKTKKGIVYDVQTQQQSLYVIGEKTKFVSRDATPDTSDTDIIYTKDAILTTCNDPHPHYGIRAQKLKVLANKLVIVGPSNLEIGGVPTPLWLPFGFYPVTKNKQTGLLFPTAYGFQAQQGLGVQGLGWYFPLGKHYNLQMRGDYYTRGNWGIKSDIDYRYRYRFNGSGSLSYNTIATEVLGELEKSKTKVFSLSWNHTQDPAARPNQSFNANVRISTNAGSVQRNLSYDYRSATRNSLNSGINFSRQFPGKPFSFSTGFTHDQNTLDHKMNLGYTANFPTQAMFPFRSVKSSTLPEGVNNFLDQFSINYNANAEARLNTIDSLLLDKATLSKVRTGIKHSASASAPVKVLKYITVSPNANFGQTFFFDQIKKQYKDVVLTRQEKDKVTGELIEVPYQIGKIDTIRQSSLTPVNNFDMGVSFNTTLFGTMQLRKGFFRGVRHKMNISGNFSYVPVLIKQTWFDSVQQVRAWSTTFQNPVYQRYSIFEGGINSVSDPGLNPKASKRVSFNIGNTLEAKIKNRKDTVARRIRLLDNFNIPISFDLSRDSMKMDGVIPMSINNNFFKGLINVNLSWGVTPYERYKTTSGQWKYINQKVWETQSLTKIGKLNIPKPFNLEGGTVNVSTGFTVRQMIDYFVKKDTAKTKIDLKPSNQNANAKQTVISELPSITTLIDNFSIRYSYAMNFNRNTFSGKDTLYVSAHQIGISGSIPLSKNWNLNIGNIGFNLGKSNPPPYIDIGISRDLHCWELAGSWQPTRQSFFFTLRVKQAPLDFLKLPIQKGNQSSFGRF